MSDALRWPRMTRGAGIALALFLGIAAQAEARGIVADMTGPNETPSVCTIGSTCPLSSAFTFNVDSTTTVNIFVYSDGLATIGSALPTTNSLGGTLHTTSIADITGTNGLANLQSLLGSAPFIALGLDPNDYGGAGATVKFDSVVNTLYWEFNNGPTPEIFGLEMDGFGSSSDPTYDNLEFMAGYGSGPTTWFNTATTGGVIGAFLPAGSVVGSDMVGSVENGSTDCPNQNYFTGSASFGYNNVKYNPVTVPVTAPATCSVSTAVPEPATWPYMLFGIGVLGLLARRWRKPIGAAA